MTGFFLLNLIIVKLHVMLLPDKCQILGPDRTIMQSIDPGWAGGNGGICSILLLADHVKWMTVLFYQFADIFMNRTVAIRRGRFLLGPVLRIFLTIGGAHAAANPRISFRPRRDLIRWPNKRATDIIDFKLDCSPPFLAVVLAGLATCLR